MRKKLQAQDWLTTVVDLDEKGLKARICGAMIDFIETEPGHLINALVQPEIRIVSLTITEGGYFIDEKTGGFNANHPDILYDVNNHNTPKTVFGILSASLEQRRLAGLEPFTVMSCDNAPHNGDLTQQTLVGLANLINPELGNWVDEKVTFPNSMVDCITPATSNLEKEKLRDYFDIEDAAPVFCEPFRQWVLEDKFTQGRPALEKVGVEFVDDVAPYELMKLRILNGGHAALAFPAALMGIHFVHDAMNESSIRNYLDKLVADEIIPTLQPLPDVNFDDYFKLVTQRFSNSEVGDTTSRLCIESSSRLPKFILPIIVVNLEANRPCPGLVMVVALWCLYCAAAAEGPNGINNEVVLVDQHAERLKRQALLARNDATSFLAMEDIFGVLANNASFIKQFSFMLETLTTDGIKASLENYCLENNKTC